MNFKNIYFCLFFLVVFCNCPANAYDLILRLQTGYNFFEMTSIKGFQKDMLDNLHASNIAAKITDDFPPYFNYQSQILLSNDSKFHFGYYLDYSSTGARIDYKDYSGELKIDHLIHQISHGFVIEYNLYSFQKNLNLIPAIKIFYSTSNLKITDKLRIFEYSYSGENEFNAVSYGFEPELSTQYFFNDIFEFKFSVAYKFNFDGELYSDQNHNNYLTRFENYAERITADWNGFKISASIGLRLKNIF